MKKNTKNESAKASKRNQSTWKIDVTSKGNTKIRGKNENVANTNITVNINVAQNSDIKTKCIVGEMFSRFSTKSQAPKSSTNKFTTLSNLLLSRTAIF